MSGPKAYTMREMKGIVDYLVEHKAYGELKGRKMWMDFSNSSLTTRTWQSLKETFLKRILPDIQNPYYRLTRDQVCSFRQGCDVAEKEKRNRLEIRSSSEERSNHAEKQKNSEQPLVTQAASTSAEKPNEVDKTAGEDIQSEKISARNRSSAETFILEDSNRQSNDNSNEDLDGDPQGPPKTMRDCLGFEESEPPPVVRAVLEDFGTDSEDSGEPPMEIVESTNKDVNENNANDQDVIVLEESENVELIENDLIIIDGGKEVEAGPTFDPEIITEVSSNDLVNWLKECAEEVKILNENNDEANTEQETSNTTNVSNEAVTSTINEGSELVVEHSEPIVIENTEESAGNLNKKSLENDSNNQNSLSTTNDTIIPNNQELLHTEVNKTNGMSNEASPKKVATRKRSSSQEQGENKKRNLNNGPEKTNGDIESTTPSSNNTEALFRALENPETMVDNTQKTQDAPLIEESHENPCLKSVSLFEEQFNTTKYIDSEDEETPIAKNDVKQPEESIVNKNISSKPNHNEESVKNKDSKKPIQEMEIVIATQNQEAIETQGNQSKIDQIPKEQDNICMENTKIHDNKEVIDISEAVNETAQNTINSRKNKHELVISSNSDSDVVERVNQNYKERYKRLSQAFGFVPGTSRTAQRRRSFQNRRARLRTISRGHYESSDGDASYTDIEDAEAFASPPHGRRNRRGRVYKKPVSGRVVSLEEEGRLFVILGNKVYPLVGDDAKDLSYVHYDASDNEEELWRQKYIDQKKKATELKRQIEQVKSEASSSRNRSPILSSTSLRKGSGGTPNAVEATYSVNHKDSAINIVQNDSGKVQITLSNNNEEKINLEGHWPQVLPIMQQVMNMFYKPENPIVVKENTKVDGAVPDAQKEDISGRTTPIIPVVSASRKVEELEREIFQEIAERGNSIETDKLDKNINVTKRKARALSSTSENSVKPAKISRKSKKSVDAKSESIQTDEKTKTTESKTQEEPRESSVPLSISDASPDQSSSKDNLTTKASKEIEGDTNDLKDNDKKEAKDNKIPKTYKLPPMEPRVTRSRKSGNDTDTSTQSLTKTKIPTPKADMDDEEVRYMLPPGPKSRKSAAKLTPTKARSPENPHEISQDRFGNSVDSTQGYQDSDASPMKNITKRKKKLSLVVKKGKNYRRKSFPSVSVDEMSLDSSNSSYFVPKKSFSHPTLDSEIYKTDSYRILMGGRKLSITKLDAIEESSKTDDVGHYNALSKTSSDSLVIEIGTGSSSIVSLPFSPELSVVENLSVSREMLQNISHPTINEHQANDSVVSNLYNQYLIADVDVSVPLMQQDCELVNTPKEKPAKKAKKPKAPAKSPIKVSDLLNKVSSANITANSTLSDTLDQRLRDLFLESAKKITNTTKGIMEVDEPKEAKKGGKKRCSTPRKRITKKSKAAVGPVIDEHMEFCAKSGRQSCPPLSTFEPLDENANNSADVQLKPKKPARVKKDIIRVKIQRPTKNKEVTGNTSQASVYTDSGINESVSINGMFHGNDNVELIHNHSETCLQAHECIGNSVEFVEDSKSSAISIHSTESLQNELDEAMKDMGELFQGQESRWVESESEEKCSEEIFATPVTTAYHSPIDIQNSSLITDDLSEENQSPPRKWYLLSEEETNTGHAHKPEQMTSNMRSSNYLRQIFPIACAVPDLSTISEISKENEESRKTLGEDSGSSSALN